MRRLALTTAAVLLVGVGGWWSVRSAPEPARPGQSGVGGSEVAPGIGGADLAGEGSGTVAGQSLPQFPGTVWRQVETLNQRRFVTWSVDTRPGGRYLLQYVCLTPGELHIRVLRGVTESWSKSVSCPGPFGSVQFVADDDELSIGARRLNHRHVEVALQVVALS
ncbi:hypothetical protein [Plantactinospora endophytica]|uniref:Uncharacterized protein n=1 Tax=Plantactinospora endophytica TaxID=673535 RepID=A0ABQ4DS54_9ACTN|nr:hypothetical protein [Plantactinospora endophytica]GIG85265.1 hypothetical protein Pen02_02010 [Plantactinospora endophytica]